MASSCSGDGRGVSLGGSVGVNAGTEASRTSRSNPDGVLSTSTRAVSLSTRKVCSTLIGTTAVAPRHEFEPLLAGLHRQSPLLHDVALVLRMRVKWWRRVARKEEFDQRKAPVASLAWHLDRCQCAEEPELFTLPGT